MQRKSYPSYRRTEKGVALIVALIMVVIMSLLGLAGVRMILQEEKMAGYAYDRTLTFQAAEAALREAENGIDQVKPEPLSGACSTFSSGIYSVRACPPALAGAATPRWLDTAFTGWANAATVGTGSLAVTPQYFVEYLGSGFPCGLDPSAPPVCKRYRVTARAGGNGRAAVMVQSLYASD
ncbi:pilus assembly PilX family protein [Hydrogenophaga laconesensis]|uniref:pilus assembly PilX family protein n=1 Tax=Hydrogenophaga laconesensis TaxID=1805971 RepID=UPI00286A223E|nr:PilX N-terminal domain-containing pilus assembly protein [Hydrogenophaga laconesensis]